MQFSSDCHFLQNELLDIARLFKKRAESIAHAFSYENGVFYNAFVIDGERFSFEDSGQVRDELEFKRLERRFAKLRLYEILSEKYGEEMPWGALTGIRPTKLAYMEKEQGRNFEKLFEEMRVCKQNIRLVERVLLAQAGVYERNDNNTALFISLPFCPTKCAYCSFITAPIDKTRHFVKDYLSCITKELSACENLSKNIRSIYIGGGTPFALETEEIREVLEAVKPYKDKFPCAEYTVEAGRPDTFTEEKLALLKEYGVDRICINPQTFSNEVLKNIGRKHTVEDFYKAYEMSKKYGFIVNIDLIAGLEGESADGFSKGVQKAIDLDADNITVHCLSLKSGAKLKEETAFLEKDGISEMIAISRELLSKAGYEPYYMYRQKYQAGNNENAGWTKTGKACVYNIDVMEEIAHNLAVGANAVSKRVWTEENRIERLGSPKDLKTYIENIEKIIREKAEFFK